METATVNPTADAAKPSNATATSPVPDQATNRAIREIASTPTAQHVIPASIVAELYRHVDDMRSTFFAGQIPEVVLSFDVRNKRNLGHYVLLRNGLGVRWNVNLNPIHLARPVFEVLATLLHELAHAWQYEKGTGAKPPHHNQEFVTKCEEMGIPTNAQGHYLGVLAESPFGAYCRARGIAVRANGVASDGQGGAEPEPLLPEPPAKPKGSRLRKWVCACSNPVPARVARSDFDATCNRCGCRYRLA
jgi:predicted SprT family Zn-dependent metalloprotease